MINVNKIAELAHELNRAWCDITGESDKLSWSESSQEIRDATIHGVKKILESHYQPTPEQMWNEWKQYKLKAGWSKGCYSVENKTHPNLVEEYEELSEIDRMKDRIFITSVSILSK